MSLAALSRRIARMEANTGIRWPHVVGVRFGETEADAMARMTRKFGPVPRGHGFMVVPEAPVEPDEVAAVDSWIEEQQRQLLEECRTLNAIMDGLNNRDAKPLYN